MRLLLILSLAFLSGCWTTSKPLPAKETDGLSGAERELDAAVDARLSKIAASVKVSSELLWDELDEDADPALKAVQMELEIAELLAGLPRLTDEQEAQARLTLAKGGKGLDAYASAKQEVERLNTVIKMADLRYEAEKAKQKAAYDAQIQAKEMELKAAEEARINDRFLVAGGVLLLAGALLIALTPAKALGAILAVHGLIIGAVPLIRNEPWFKYAVGGFLLVAVLALGFTVYRHTKKPSCDADDEPSSSN